MDVRIFEKRTPAISVIMELLISDKASKCVEWDQTSIYEGGEEVIAGGRCWRTRSGRSCEVVDRITSVKDGYNGLYPPGQSLS